MKLVRGNETVEILNENVIEAFKSNGFEEAPEIIEEAPKPKRSTKKADK